MQQRGIEDKINSLSRDTAERIWRELKGKEKKYPGKKPHTKVRFPVTSTVSFGVWRPCISWQDALCHLGEVLIQDVDKKSSPTIKGQIVEACATLAEIAENTQQRKAILSKAVKVVLEMDRSRLMSQVATMATMT